MSDTYTPFLYETEPKEREQSIESYLKTRLQNLSRAVAGYTDVSLAGLSGTVDLSPTQAKHRRVRLIGEPAGAVTLRIPHATGANCDIIFANALTGSFSTVIVKSTGANAGNPAGVSLSTARTRIVAHDGESAYPVTADTDAVVSSLYTGLVAFWKLEEASGTRNDSHGTNHLTDTNTVTQAAGKIGFASQFTAANSERLTVADNAALSTGNIDFSICAWVYLDSKTGFRTVVGKGDGTTAGSEYVLDYSNVADRFRFYVSNGTTLTIATANALGSPATGTWYFIVAWHDAAADTVNIQVNNGTVNSSAHTVGVQDAANSFNIGATSLPAGFMDGRGDGVGFWKKVLSSAERTELYNEGAGRAYPF